MIVRSVARDEADRVGGAAQVAGDQREVDASIATSVPVPIARPRSAWASAGASLTPSPTIATTRPSACRRRIDVGLVGRQHLGDHLVDADLGGDRARGRARCRRSAAPGAGRARCSRATASADVGLTVSATASSAAHLAVPGDQDRGAARAPRRRGGRRRARPGRAGSTRPSAPGARPATPRPSTTPSTPRPSRLAKRLDGLGSGAELVARGARRSPARSGARRRPRARRRGAAASAASTPSAATTSASAIRPGGHGAGLVEHDRVDAARGLEDLRALDQQPELGAAAGADEQRGRRGEPERARAGDDQHRDGGGERERERPRRRRARSRAWRPRCRSRPARRRPRRGRRAAAPAPCRTARR